MLNTKSYKIVGGIRQYFAWTFNSHPGTIGHPNSTTLWKPTNRPGGWHLYHGPPNYWKAFVEKG